MRITQLPAPYIAYAKTLNSSLQCKIIQLKEALTRKLLITLYNVKKHDNWRKRSENDYVPRRTEPALNKLQKHYWNPVNIKLITLHDKFMRNGDDYHVWNTYKRESWLIIIIYRNTEHNSAKEIFQTLCRGLYWWGGLVDVIS